LDRSDLGAFMIESPTFEVICEGDSSNVEKLAAKLLEGPSSSTPTPKVKLSVADGSGTILDKDAGKSWKVAGLHVSAATGESGALHAELAGKLSGAEGTGEFAVEASVGPTLAATVKARDLPADIASPWLRRADSSMQFAGKASADLKIEQTTEAGKTVVRAKGQASATDVRAALSALGDETLRLAAIRAPVDAVAEGNVLTLNRFGVECDLGSASATGSVDLAAAPETWLSQAGLAVALDVDAAKTAERLPKLLRLRPGTRIEHGTLNVKAASKAAGGGQIL
jgi:hypothetical protein